MNDDPYIERLLQVIRDAVLNARLDRNPSFSDDGMGLLLMDETAESPHLYELRIEDCGPA